MGLKAGKFRCWLHVPIFLLLRLCLCKICRMSWDLSARDDVPRIDVISCSLDPDELWECGVLIPDGEIKSPLESAAEEVPTIEFCPFPLWRTYTTFSSSIASLSCWIIGEPVLVTWTNSNPQPSPGCLFKVTVTSLECFRTLARLRRFDFEFLSTESSSLFPQFFSFSRKTSLWLLLLRRCGGGDEEKRGNSSLSEETRDGGVFFLLALSPSLTSSSIVLWAPVSPFPLFCAYSRNLLLKRSIWETLRLFGPSPEPEMAVSSTAVTLLGFRWYSWNLCLKLSICETLRLTWFTSFTWLIWESCKSKASIEVLRLRICSVVSFSSISEEEEFIGWSSLFLS